MGTRHFLILGSPDRAHRAILLQPHPMSFLTLPLPGSLPLLLPFFSSPEAAVTVTWSLLFAPFSQGLPWAGPLISSGKSGLFVIKEEATSLLSANPHSLPVPQTMLKFNHRRVQTALGGKQVGEPSRDPFAPALRRVPALHCVPKGDRARRPPGLFLSSCRPLKCPYTRTRPPSKTHIHTQTHTHIHVMTHALPDTHANT